MLNFLKIPVVRDIGEDYTIQSRSEFDWYNPHLYNFYCLQTTRSRRTPMTVNGHTRDRTS